MHTFRIAYSGDYLDEHGNLAYGDIGLRRLDAELDVTYRFLKDLAPKPGDVDYWSRSHSLHIRPEHLEGANGLIIVRIWVQRSAFARGAKDLVVIGRAGAGYDKVDLAACTEHGVAVFNAPLALQHSTASTALMFMLALAKRLFDQDRATRQGRWDQQSSLLGSELQGRTLGIVGLGHIGRELARIVAPFDMRILAFSPHADPAAAEALGVRLTSLDELLRESDFVSLHCRLSQATRGMFGPAQIEAMKPTAFFINVGRGALVDQQALTEALRARRIAGAGLDVFTAEPLPPDDPLIALDNVILTPHFSPSTADSWAAAGNAMIDGMLRASRGQVPENVVNPEVLATPEFRRKLSRFEPSR